MRSNRTVGSGRPNRELQVTGLGEDLIRFQNPSTVVRKEQKGGTQTCCARGLCGSSNGDGSDGSNPRRLTVNEVEDEFPSFSPDGRQIVFMSIRDGNWEIYVMKPIDSAQIAEALGVGE